MAWARVDDGWWAHPKVLALSLEARGMWVSALSWSCAQRRDVVPVRFVRMLDAELGEACAAELVDAGLWVAVENGFRIHDWQQYQEQSISEKRADAGRKGGIRSGETRSKGQAKGSKQSKQPASKPDLVEPANDEAGTRPGPAQPVPSPPARSPVLATDRDSRDGSSSPAPRVERARNEFYDAACQALDMPTRGDHESLIGAIAAKARVGGHEPEEIMRRAALHLATFNFPLTPGSLNKRWDELGSKVVTATPAERQTIAQHLERMRRRELITGGTT